VSAANATDSAPLLNLLLGLEGLLLLAGVALLISRRRLLLPRLLDRASSPLTPSSFLVHELLIAVAFAFGGAVVFQFAAATLGRSYLPPHDPAQPGAFYIVAGAAFQLGLLAGLGHVWFWHLRPARRPAPLIPTPPHASLPLSRILRGGFFTFIAALVAVCPTAILWQSILDWCGIDAPPQDLVRLFGETGDLASLAVLVTLAVVIAPLTEELAFRVGLFRWLRGRVPRVLALVLPALVFAAIHGYLSIFGPLVVLAVVLGLGYEHYGHPAVPILAHALFNLNTVALLLAGLPA